MLAVVSHPTDDRAFDRHRARGTKRDLETAVGLERLVGEEPVVADGDPEAGDGVHQRSDGHVAPAQPAAPRERNRGGDRKERDHDEHADGDLVSARLLVSTERGQRGVDRVNGLVVLGLWGEYGSGWRHEEILELVSGPASLRNRNLRSRN